MFIFLTEESFQGKNINVLLDMNQVPFVSRTSVLNLDASVQPKSEAGLAKSSDSSPDSCSRELPHFNY